MARMGAGLTEEALEAAAGVPEGTVRRFEMGASGDHAGALQDALREHGVVILKSAEQIFGTRLSTS
jgi:hypothetical protein